MKRIVLILSLLFLCGCSAKVEQRHLGRDIEFSFFYIEGCSECNAFKKEAIPYLEQTFQDEITIHQYDLDDEKTQDVYDQVIDSLQDFDESLYGNGPMYALDGYFAKLGYSAGDEKYLVDDIEKAIKGEELSEELSSFRYDYQRIELSYFYVDGCGECAAFKKEAIPYLEKRFSHRILIKQYNLDKEETKSEYDKVIQSLEGFDQSLYGKGPMYAIDGYFARVGYTVGDEEFLADDIVQAMKGKEVSQELGALRYFYKESL